VATLLLVHAHPDDESISTGGAMLRAHLDGHRVVLVTGTRGEEGEIHNLDEATTRPRLAEVRTEELRAACAVLGVDRQEFLGYRDSGMDGTPANDDPGSFHQAPLTETAERLAEILREERPDVVVTYTPDGTYGHPDHIKAHRTTLAALDRLREEGWRPQRVYLQAISESTVRELAERFSEFQEQSEIRLIGVPDEDITTRLDVRDVVAGKLRALECHHSQMDQSSPFATMARQVLEAVLGWETYILVGARGGPAETTRSLVDEP
jgi:LmbE family N-acetylglucosaminyl deacetylase